MTTKVRWGVLSTAKIGREKVIPALQRAANCEVVALASRDPERGRRVAESLAIPRVFESYEALLAAEAIDAIYNPLPNHLHVPLSIAALRAGKHVLCEKPIAMTVAEALTLKAAAERASHLKLMEAFMYRHHPRWRRLRELVETGCLGKLRCLQASFCYFNEQPGDIRNSTAAGGGGLMDIGCYPISAARWLFAAEPHRVLGWMQTDPRFGTDRLTAALLEFDAGVASFTCSTQLPRGQRLEVCGDRGRAELEWPFNPPADQPTEIQLYDSTGHHREPFAACDQYELQVQRFADAVLHDRPVPTPLDDAVDNMRVIAAVARSAQRSEWEPLAGPLDAT